MPTHSPMTSPRRTFLKTMATGAVLAAGASMGLTSFAHAADGPLVLPPLPFEPNALEPVITAHTLSFHYDKHHAGYVRKGNAILKDMTLPSTKLEDIVMMSWNDKNMKLFNNAAQVYNHNIYWESLSPKGGTIPAKMQDLLKRDFGSVDAAKKTLADAAKTRFASGWAWLASDKGTLKIMNTMNAETPLTDGMEPLLVIDVWEHAYYLDYQNKRGEYVDTVIDKLLNWEGALAKYEQKA